ncbi:MAG TPA: hypothetical protein VMI54_28770 [Polyangiaceae bacterium]|nr:hypothetical protein [Polyangiaceae bacterium]
MPAERAARNPRRRALFALVLATACVSGPEDEVGVTAPRYLDQLCANDAYQLQGSAVRTTGITDDSCGFVLGPGAGSISFDITIPAAFDSYDVSALVTERGKTSWVSLASGVTPAGYGGAAGIGSFTLTTDGDEKEVSDVRVRGVAYPSCSVSRRARRR